MKPGEQIQYACGHWLTAGAFGIQDESIKHIPTKRCGPCSKQLRDAAPDLLAALKQMTAWLRDEARAVGGPCIEDDMAKVGEAAIAKAEQE